MIGSSGEEEEKNDKTETETVAGLNGGFVEIKDKISPNLIWIRVLKKDFFLMSDCDGTAFGVECQQWSDAGDKYGGKGGYESFMLLQKYNKGDKVCWRNLISITLNTSQKFVGEFKQHGNQFVGNQSVYGVSGDEAANLFMSFMEKHYPNIAKYSSDIDSLNVPQKIEMGSNGFPQYGGYASVGLVYLMKNQTERFVEYTYTVPKIAVFQLGLIKQYIGDEFFESKKSVAETFNESPIEFFKKIPRFLQTRKEELFQFLQTINILQYYKNPELKQHIVPNLPILLNHINPKDFFEILKETKIEDFFGHESNVFRELIKSMSSKGGEYKKMLFDYIDANFSTILNSFGGKKGAALGRLIDMLNYPKLEVHKDAKINPDTGAFEIIRDDGRGNKIKKTIADENLIFSSKERKMLLDKHKDEIKSFFDAPGKNPEIEYIRFLIKHLPESQSKGQLLAMKDDFINYYNKKFDDGTSEYTGKMLFDALINQLKFKLGEKSKRKSFDFLNIWENKFKKEYPFKNEFLKIPDMSIQDMNDGKFIVSLLKYFYRNIKPNLGKLEYSEEGKPKFVNLAKESVTQALSDFLYITAALNGFSKEEISVWLNKINTNFIKMGEAERNPNKYKIPSPTPSVVSWANKESLYSELKSNLDEQVIRSYIKNEIFELWKK